MSDEAQATAKKDAEEIMSELRGEAVIARAGGDPMMDEASVLEVLTDACLTIRDEARQQGRKEMREEAAVLMDDWPCRATAIRNLKE